MATPQENLERMQEIARRGLQDRLEPAIRGRFDELVKRGLVQVQVEQSFERPSDAPRLLRGMNDFETLQVARGGGQIPIRNPDPEASIGMDIDGNRILNMHGKQFFLDDPRFTVNDVPEVFAAIDEGIRDVAPFMAGGVVTAPMKTIPAMAAQAGIGLAKEATEQPFNPEGFDFLKLATTPVFAFLGEGAGRAIAKIAAPVLGRLFGRGNQVNIFKEDGSLTDDALQALEKSGATPSELDELMSRELLDNNVLTPQQAERFNLFKRFKLDPTRAQVTRSADDFQLQQEAAKVSTPVRQAIETQEATLTGQLDDAISATGGELNMGISPVADAVQTKALSLDAEINRLYQLAREGAPTEQFVRLDKFVDNLRKLAPDNRITNGLINSVKGDLVERGVINSDWQVTGRIDVETAEKIRQTLNARFDSTTPFGRSLIRDLKNTLDDDVMRAAGEDLFLEARRAKSAFESGLNVTKLNKFDKNQRSLVRGILENTIREDDVFDRAVLGRTFKHTDLEELKSFLTSGTDEQVAVGTQAWNDLRAETLDWIKTQAFNGPVDEHGFQSMSRAALERAVNRIGNKRLTVLFNREEMTFLNDLMKLSKLREPVRGTAIGQGPSAQAVRAATQSIREEASKVPVLGHFFRNLKLDESGRLVLDPLRKTAEAVKAAQQPVRNAVRTAVARPAAAVSVGASDLVENR